VLVVDWCGYRDGCGAGVLSLIGPIDNGLRGVVVDGAWRDVEDVAALGLPLFGRGISPHSPAKQAAGEINVPVSCGGVIVEPGDIVVGDRDGVAVVPRRGIEAVLAVLPAHQPRDSIEQYARADLGQMTAERGAEYRAAFGLSDTGSPARD
jgi:4-hydroxy-4-methyl-2-oxoglutarate aldolase